MSTIRQHDITSHMMDGLLGRCGAHLYICALIVFCLLRLYNLRPSAVRTNSQYSMLDLAVGVLLSATFFFGERPVLFCRYVSNVKTHIFSFLLLVAVMHGFRDLHDPDRLLSM